MSGDIIKGKTSRKIMTIMAAIFAVAMMLAVPLVVAVDSDADFTKDEQGFCVTYTNPTDAQLPSMVKAMMIMEALSSEMVIFNVGIFENIAVSDDPITLKMASGEKIDSDTITTIGEFEVSADKITITITATDDGTLIAPSISDMPSVYKDAAAAIKTVMGDEVTAGDVVKITGSLNIKMAMQEDEKYNLLDGDKCIIGKDTISTYYVKNYDLTVSFKHGSAEEVSIKLFSDLKGMMGDEQTYEYETTPIAVGTKYTIKDTVSTLNVTGDTHYTVKDKDYTMVYTPDPTPDVKLVVDASNIKDQSSFNTQEIKDRIADLPAATDNITVDKTYGGAQSAFDNVVMEAVGNDLLKLILIIGGVILGIIVLIIILIIVLVVLKKKKK